MDELQWLDHVRSYRLHEMISFARECGVQIPRENGVLAGEIWHSEPQKIKTRKVTRKSAGKNSLSPGRKNQNERGDEKST